MTRRRKLYFTVTNDLSCDQRMIRICSSLSREYAVTLVGRKLPQSLKLEHMPFSQKRLYCLFKKGLLFYAEYNFRLFLFLLFERMDLVCAIDLDTILPCYFISRIKKISRVYDAHELFCEMKEVVTRPSVYKCWKAIESYSVPRFKNGYTVNPMIAREFAKMYGSDYQVIRNLPVASVNEVPSKEERYILYQGAVNEGRSFETLIPAMKQVNARLIICGDGNFMKQAKQLVKENQLEEKVFFAGKMLPSELRQYTNKSWAGVTLFENRGLSNYLSLGNRFFDYMQAGIPQLCVNYPLYKEINDLYEVAFLIEDCSPESVSEGLNALLNDEGLYKRLQNNALCARSIFSWQQEEQKLLDIYRTILMK